MSRKACRRMLCSFALEELPTGFGSESDKKNYDQQISYACGEDDTNNKMSINIAASCWHDKFP